MKGLSATSLVVPSEASPRDAGTVRWVRRDDIAFISQTTLRVEAGGRLCATGEGMTWELCNRVTKHLGGPNYED